MRYGHRLQEKQHACDKTVISFIIHVDTFSEYIQQYAYPHVTIFLLYPHLKASLPTQAQLPLYHMDFVTLPITALCYHHHENRKQTHILSLMTAII